MVELDELPLRRDLRTRRVDRHMIFGRVQQ